MLPKGMSLEAIDIARYEAEEERSYLFGHYPMSSRAGSLCYSPLCQRESSSNKSAIVRTPFALRQRSRLRPK